MTDPNASFHSQHEDESFSDHPESADGTLIIVVCKARHLPNRRTLDKQSPYVTLRIGTLAKKTTAEFRAGQRPTWSQELRFDLTRDRRPIMKVDVLDDCKAEPTPIGNCEIDCSMIFSDDKLENNKYIHDDWYDLSQNGRRAGQIYLEMTFYPSAPVVPPKVPESNWSASQQHTRPISPQYPSYKATSPPSPPPDSPQRSNNNNKSVVDEVFISSLNSDKSKRSSLFMRNSNTSTATTNTAHSEVFVNNNKDDSDLKGGKKYLSKFNKLKDRFAVKEPIGKLWSDLPSSINKLSTKPSSPPPDHLSISPISSYGGMDQNEYDEEDLDKLRKQMQPSDDEDEDPDEIEFIKPPSPPPHTSKPSSPRRRKPPIDYSTTVPTPTSPGKIPFSADSIGVFNDDISDTLSDKFEGLPTSVYNSSSYLKPHTLNPNEIDPKNYAPTPDEHLNRRLKLQNGRGVTKEDLKIDLRTDMTGYLGNGKFSPSVFQRAVGHNYDDEIENRGNKPQVPPKIPQGLTEVEYYAIEKDKYLKDLNGKRF
ncbi:hypothetical protein DFJ63DRAFT_323616 [Scheffersomyces coipomensis]|uniref:uncharacterized protein n=1 Tax=Scheffersomyces coipomensis TaxID=1788519 RepID=UPI00315D0F82